MPIKISGLTAISGGTFADADLFEVSVDTGGGNYVSRKMTGAELKASIGLGELNNVTITTPSTNEVLT